MSLVQFLGIYFVHRAGIDITVVGLAFLCESLARGLLAPVFGALSDRLGRRVLLIAASLCTALILPAFLLVTGPATLLAWSLALGTVGAINIPVSSALLLDLAP
ncbi:MAG TPA: MFS transporter, partial [Burkholderiales bacterium]